MYSCQPEPRQTGPGWKECCLDRVSQFNPPNMKRPIYPCQTHEDRVTVGSLPEKATVWNLSGFDLNTHGGHTCRLEQASHSMVMAGRAMLPCKPVGTGADDRLRPHQIRHAGLRGSGAPII